MKFEKYSRMAYAIDDRKKYISLSFHSYCKFNRKTLLSGDHSIQARLESPQSLFLNFLIFQRFLLFIKSVTSNLSVRQHHPEALLNHHILDPTLKVSNSESDGTQEFLCPTSSQVVPMVLVRQPHFKRHWVH